MQEAQVRSWVDGYVRAWESNEPADIAALFTDDARCHTEPYVPPWTGKDGIVAGWRDRLDGPGTWTFRFEVAAVAGATGFVQGRTEYLQPPKVYHNLWVITLDDDLRSSEFTEWWMLEEA